MRVVIDGTWEIALERRERRERNEDLEYERSILSYITSQQRQKRQILSKDSIPYISTLSVVQQASNSPISHHPTNQQQPGLTHTRNRLFNHDMTESRQAKSSQRCQSQLNINIQIQIKQQGYKRRNENENNPNAPSIHALHLYKNKTPDTN